MNVPELLQRVVDRKGQSLNGDEGVQFGDPAADIHGLLVTWMPTVTCLQEASRRQCNVVLCHEAFYLVPQGQTLSPAHLTWASYRNRTDAAHAAGLTVVRVHGSLDMICIWDDFVAALGIEDPTPGTGWGKVLPIAETTVGDLVEDVKKRLGLACVRVAGDLTRRVRIAGFPWGGLGLDSNIGYMARCIELGADVLIAGECDEYGMTFALDAGVPVIETGHSVSENIGLEHFARTLTAEFPDLPVSFYPDTRCFEYH